MLCYVDAANAFGAAGFLLFEEEALLLHMVTYLYKEYESGRRQEPTLQIFTDKHVHHILNYITLTQRVHQPHVQTFEEKGNTH